MVPAEVRELVAQREAAAQSQELPRSRRPASEDRCDGLRSD
jgi:hypothetical protein